MEDSFHIATLSPGLLQASIALSTARAGELALLDFEFARDQAAVASAIQRFSETAGASFGVRLGLATPEFLAHLLSNAPNHLTTILFAASCSREWPSDLHLLKEKKLTTLLEVTSLEEAERAAAMGADALVATGHETGGRIGEETTFVLLQRLLAQAQLPVWARGGIGIHTAAACAGAGAAGIILDAQLTLTRESSFPDAWKAKIASMDGSETICLGDQLQDCYRMYFRPGNAVVKELQELESRLAGGAQTPADARNQWREALAQRAGWDPARDAVLVGQDAAFAAPLAKRFQTVGGILRAMREAVVADCQAATQLRPLAEDSSLAVSHGTRYPILQGPMTRVSDVPEFAGRVAEGGGLPFLALALMRGTEIQTLLEEAKSRLGSRPWGVGILGFVPPAQRQEQMDVVVQYRPPFALIAGGRPEQAKMLEQKGITTYLHVPSPGLLRLFVQDGARRFVFEGRECGGHVGPRTSFVLWNQMVEALLSAPELVARPEEFHIVFAAGIHDALSAAMVSIIAAPLAKLGVRIGVLIGTAYLFTEEAVASGAIVETFQEQALACRQTVLLTTGPGHSTRCVDTAFAAAFAEERRRMSKAGFGAEEIRLALEDLNLGRLRIAAKGVTRHPEFGRSPDAPRLLKMQQSEQVDQGMYMIGQVAGLRQSTCTVQQLHHDIAVEGSHRLQHLVVRSAQPRTSGPAVRSSDVAIIGMAVLMPKASNLTTYWENILQKVDAIGEIPKDRWDWERYFDANPRARDRIYSRWGGFLDDIHFDPMQYGMPPATLRSIEPSQLLTLEAVRAALADAGYADRPFERERTSVILGAGGGAADLGLGYSARAFVPMLEDLPEFRGRSQEILDRLDGRLPEWTEDSFAGILTNVSSGRVANRFDLGGSNYTVDAACASSLAAVSLALKELEYETSDMVVVGGVDTMQNPFTYLCFSKTHALSPRGRCRTFDDTADGIAISEGLAIMVFKRLADAERDGDRIYAVIKGSGSSSDGKDRGLTAPRPEGQMRALRRAYAKAGVSPATVELVEAHGTGTAAGDSAEVQALTTVFKEAQAPLQGCAIGSVKSMVGHTKCSAGAAGMVKAALALHHKVLPPTLGVEKPNSRAKFQESPFFVNTEARPWLQNTNGHPRRAGVSAFGFGGTNFHTVLEEYTGAPTSAEAPLRQWSHELFLWKAHTREDLVRVVDTWERALATSAKPTLRDLAFTAWKQLSEKSIGNGHALPRLAIVATSVEDLKQKLASVRQRLSKPDTDEIKDPSGIYLVERPLASEGKLAFTFPGQGSQYPRMLQDLMLHFPEMRAAFEQAERDLGDKLGKPLSDYVFPPPTFGPEEERSQQRALTKTNVAQPALGAASLAMLSLLQELGLRPDVVAGHSYGEYVALTAAKVFSAEALMAVSEARGRFIVEEAGTESGVMAAVEGEADAVAAALKNVPDVWIANANAPRQTVISGAQVAIERVVEQLAGQGMTARMIPVACAFHSPLVAPAQARLAQFLARLEAQAPQIPVYSNNTAAPYPQDPEAVKALLAAHLTQPVQFVREVQAMYADGARIFVEVGARGVLTALTDEILKGRPKLAVASNQSGRPGLPQLLHMLGQLAAHGCALKLDRLYQHRSTRYLKLDQLELECRPTPPPASAWLVNGARVKPLNQNSVPSMRQMPSDIRVENRPIPEVAPQSQPPLAVASAPQPLPVAGESETLRRAVTAPQAAVAPQVAPVLIPAPTLDASSQVMAEFQRTMERFLETQRTVMLAFLGSEAGAVAASAQTFAVPPLEVVASQPAPMASFTPESVRLAPAAPLPNSEIVISAPAPIAPTQVATPVAVSAAEPQPVAAPSGPSREELTQQLLAIVSERTGYPPEMLDLKSDLEADLSIDSIKRVEILGTFRSQIPSGVQLEEGLMEKLAGVRTLQGIIDKVFESVGGQAAVTSASQSARSEAQPTLAPAPAAAPSGPTREELTQQLLAIVSERTGYPPEMLRTDADLEADLSIDSIKRVEILGTFRSRIPSGVQLEEGLMEKLAGVRTLQSIIDRVLESIGGQSAKPAQPAATASTMVSPAPKQPAATEQASPAASEEQKVQRYTLEAVEVPPGGQPRTLSKERPILIVGDHATARGLSGELLKQGYKVAMARHGHSVREESEGSYCADMNSPASVAELIALLRQRQGAPVAIVHLLSMDKKDEQFGLSVKSLFYLAKAAGASLREGAAESGASLIAATTFGGTFLSGQVADEVAEFPIDGGIAGLMKTLALEWPEVLVKAVDLNLKETAQALARHLFEELHTNDGVVEVGHDGRRRLTLKPLVAPLQAIRVSAPALDESSVVLLTGGARGITARAAKLLAERYRPTLILTGRSELPAADEAADTADISTPKELKAVLIDQIRSRGEAPTPVLVEREYARLMRDREIRANLAALTALGCAVHYHRVDVSDPEAFASFIDGVYTNFGKLDGVIHGAGLVEDKLIEDKTPESFARVFNTKVVSSHVLSQKLRPESLRFLVLYSSISGRFGNRGQGDYAAANEVLNKLAVRLDRIWPARVVAINWGPWDNGGMVSAEVRKQFAERGVALISPAAGLQLLDDEIHYGRKGEAEVLVGGAVWHAADRPKVAVPNSLPLLGKAVFAGDQGILELVREIDVAHDLYLDDHRLDGQPVLPFAVATEFMAEAVAHGWPEMQVVAIREARVLAGIVLDNGSKTVRIVARPEAGGGSSPTSVTVEVSGTGKVHRVHYRCKVELAPRLPAAPQVEIAPLVDGEPLSLEVPEAYRQWLFHGPLFQGIHKVDAVSTGGIRALLGSSSPDRWITGARGSWLIDPLMFDSALQLVVLWARHQWDATALPAGFDRIRRFAAPSAAGVVCELRFRPTTNKQTLHADIYFLDAKSGSVLSIIENMEGACSKALNRLATPKAVAAAGETL
jgi:acyl transferase domain-containing protein/NAD(P)H-dependent flavin oxidoreductase YrpB (nitropropane dioxygenase family)/NADP-dependent 3-hydroxy acid dehydrogenase YdfG